MGQHDAAGLGQHELPIAALEQPMPEPLLELAQLNRQRRRRHVQRLGGSRQVAPVRDDPEVAQVMEVEIGHRKTLILLND